MKKITMTNLGPDDISIHYTGEQATPVCVLDKACLKYLLSKEYNTEEQTHAQWGDYVMKYVETKGIPNWILFEHGKIVKPYVVLNFETFAWLKEGVGLQLSRVEMQTLDKVRRRWETQ